MTIQELNKMTFDEAMAIFLDEDCFTTIDALKSFVIECIKDDLLWVAVDILRNIGSVPQAEYFHFDYSCASYSRPSPIQNLKDLEMYCENYVG